MNVTLIFYRIRESVTIDDPKQIETDNKIAVSDKGDGR